MPFYLRENTMKKVCSRCENIILHKQRCEYTPKYTRKVSDEKKRFYSPVHGRNLGTVK